LLGLTISEPFDRQVDRNNGMIAATHFVRLWQILLQKSAVWPRGSAAGRRRDNLIIRQSMGGGVQS
jgi:hypothetical protein